MTLPDVHDDEMFDADPTSVAFARQLREAADAAGPPVLYATLASVLDGLVAPPVPAPSQVPTASPPRRSRRLRAIVGGLVFGVAVGGLGVAGALPGPVQRQVSRAGRAVGIELPTGTDAPAPTTTTTTPPTSTTVVRPRNQPGPTTSAPADDGHGKGPDETPAAERDDRGQGDDHRQDDDRGLGDERRQDIRVGGEGPVPRSRDGATGRYPIGSEENHHRA